METENIKPGIAEGGNRMENTQGGRLPQRIFQAEPQGQNHRPDAFDDKGADQQVLLVGNEAGKAAGTDGFRHDQLRLEADLFSEQKISHGGGGHKAQTADFNHEQNDDLTERTPLGPCVRQRKPGDAGGGGRGEQRNHHAGTMPVPGGNRQGKQQRAEQNQPQKDQGHDAPDTDRPPLTLCRLYSFHRIASFGEQYTPKCRVKQEA